MKSFTFRVLRPAFKSPAKPVSRPSFTRECWKTFDNDGEEKGDRWLTEEGGHCGKGGIEGGRRRG